MTSSVTKAFRKCLDQLPTSVQEQADELWREDPYLNSLQFRQVSQCQPIYSAHISIRFKILLRLVWFGDIFASILGLRSLLGRLTTHCTGHSTD
jgi:hypothetical protein